MFMITRKYIFLTFLIFFPFKALTELTEEQLSLLERLPPDQRESIMSKMEQSNDLNEEIEDVFEEESNLVERPEKRDNPEEICEECIYGYDIFKFSPSTFAPTDKVPLSPNYVLGPGDEVRVVIYGSEQINFKDFIDRDGMLNIPKLGPTYLAGLTLNQAENLLTEKIESNVLWAEISISLSKLRSITVYLLGEAYKPGSYTLSSLSTVTSALFASGGVSKKGSLRTIQIKRDGKTIKTYDFYKFILSGDVADNIRLQDGDTIYIPFYENTVKIGGAFKRPYLYEFIEGENISDAIKMAGGFLGSVRPNPKIEINSIDLSSLSRNIRYAQNEELKNIKLLNGDIVSVAETASLYRGEISLRGEVKNPGSYSISEGDTILDIITRAGGYTEESYVYGAVFTRKQVAEQQKAEFLRSADVLENSLLDIIQSGAITNIQEFTLAPISNIISRLKNQEPIGRQVVDLDILKLKTDPYHNFIVKDGDELFIPSRPDHIAVVGEVQNVVTLRFNPDIGALDYIDLAGGLKTQADVERILLIHPNGESKLIKKTLFSRETEILPGSTIVVNRQTRPLDYLQLTQIVTPILANLATSAAAIAAISRD